MGSEAAKRAYYERNRQQVIERATAWHNANPERSREIKRRSSRVNSRDRMLKQRYGISETEYETILEKQGWGCAICGATSDGRKALQVDHCHETADVRGILCGPCNRLLGHAKDSIEVLQAAIVYLQSWAPTGAKEG